MRIFFIFVLDVLILESLFSMVSYKSPLYHNIKVKYNNYKLRRNVISNIVEYRFKYRHIRKLNA